MVDASQLGDAGPVGAMVAGLAVPAAVLDTDLRIVGANAPFRGLFSGDAQRAWRRALEGRTGGERLREVLGQLRTNAPAIAAECDLPLFGVRRLMLQATRLAAPPNGLLLIVGEVSEPAAEGAERSGAKRRTGALAAATHDLRQPLQAMTLLGSLLMRRVADPDTHKLITRLEDSIATMSGMLNTLLDAVRWDETAADAEIGNFVVNDVFDRLRVEFDGRVREQGLRLRVVACRRTVHSDARLLSQALRTLMQYALQHSQAGRMLLGARRRGRRLRVELWDTGFEPPAADMQSLYDALRPGRGRRAALNPSLAPALTLVRRIADMLGHRLDIGFKPGCGSVFSIELPLVVAAPAVRRPAVAADPERAARGTVFIVDDDPAVRETMRDLLEATGWATEDFATSEEFLRADQPGRTGCVLVDALLPGLSGVELLCRLKEQRHRLPAIMLTGAGDVRMAVEAMAAGALNFIEKPVRFEELLPSIERAFDLLADSSRLEAWRESALRRAASLTARQRQILERVLAGQPSRNIAADLGVSRRTVENHRAIIMKKMGAASIPQLIRVGIAAS